MSAALSDVVNTPLTIVLNGREFKAKRPGIAELYRVLESLAVQKELSLAKLAADEFGLEGAERIKYLRESHASIPRGEAMNQLAWQMAGSAEGMLAILTSALMSARDLPADLDDLITVDFVGATQAVTQLTNIGIDETENDGGPEKNVLSQ